MFEKIKKAFFVLSAISMLFISCKKDPVDPSNGGDEPEVKTPVVKFVGLESEITDVIPYYTPVNFSVVVENGTAEKIKIIKKGSNSDAFKVQEESTGSYKLIVLDTDLSSLKVTLTAKVTVAGTEIEESVSVKATLKAPLTEGSAAVSYAKSEDQYVISFGDGIPEGKSLEFAYAVDADSKIVTNGLDEGKLTIVSAFNADSPVKVYQIIIDEETGDISYAVSEISIVAIEAPTNLTVVERTESSIKLSWTNTTDPALDKVIVEYGEEKSKEVEKDVSEVVIDGLESNTSYTFKVSSADATGAKSKAAEVNTKTMGTIKVSNVKAYSNTSGSLIVTWTDATDESVAGYTLKYGTTEENVAVGSGKYYTTGLTDATLDNISIQSKNSEGLIEGTLVAANEVTVKEHVYKSIEVKGNEEAAKRHVVANAFLKNGLSTGYVGTFATGKDSTIITKTYAGTTVWEVVPALADPSNPDAFSLRSYANPSLYLYGDLENNYKISGSGTINDGGVWIESGIPVGGVNSWDPNGKSLVIVKEVGSGSSDELKKAASFVKAATDEDGYGLIKWYKDNDLIFREYWNTMALITTEKHNSSDPVYGELKFVDAAPKASSAITVASAAASNVEKDSLKLTWSVGGVDAAAYGFAKVAYGDSTSVNVEGTEVSITGLTVDTSYTFTITAYDVYGRASSEAAATVTQSTKPDTTAVSYVTAVADRTGAVALSWKDYDANHTYKVDCSDGTSKTVAAGVQKAMFTGLTIGTEYIFTITTMDGDTALDAADPVSVTAKKIVWQIANAYTADNSARYSLFANDSSLDIASCTESALAGKKYNRWIVMPALDGSDGFSLQASNADSVDTGLYMYVDYSKTNKNFESGGQGDRPHIFVGKLTKSASGISIANGAGTAVTDPLAASFTRGARSTSCNVDLTGLNAPDFDYWTVIKSNYTDSSCVDGKSYTFYDTWNRDSVEIGGEQRGYSEYNFAVHETALDNDEWAGDPTPVTSVQKTSDEYLSITLEWTNPADKDFDYVNVTLNGTTVKTSGTTATFTGLTAGTEYTYSIVAYDFVGKASSAVSDTVSTKEAAAEITAVTTVSAANGYTGQVIVTWEDTNALSYTVSDGTNSKKVDAGVKKAIFNGLTVGTEYTFTVVADGQPDEATVASDTAIPAKLVWKLIAEYGSRQIVPTMMKDSYTGTKCAKVSYNIVAADTNSNDGGNNTTGNDFTNIKYKNWLVLPSLSNPDSEDFSLMATDETGVESGFYMYMDEAHRAAVDSFYLSNWWGGYNEKSGENHAMIATLDGSENSGVSFITNNNQASFELSKYDGKDCIISKSGKYLLHFCCVFAAMDSGNNDAKLSIETVTLE